jgi:hypothetical protein
MMTSSPGCQFTLDPLVEVQRADNGFSRKIRSGIAQLQCREQSPFYASM